MTVPPWRPTTRAPRLVYRLPVPWTDYPRSTPLADFTAALTELRRLGLGQGGCVGTFVWMNFATYTHMRRNCNPKDMYGRRSTSHSRGLSYINQMLTGDDLPAVELAPLPDGVAVMSEPDRRGVLLRVV